MSPEARARVAARSRQLDAGVTLGELRELLELTQSAIADRTGATSSSISKLEKRTDTRVATLRRYVEALGGELELVARFPEGSVVIRQFGGHVG
ncbi:MAG: XRE family transcriptional regulator [Gemmatimonadota bacterium]